MPQRTVQSDSRKTFCVAVSAVALSATVAAVWFHDSHGSQLATLPELIAEAHRLETVLQHDSSRGTALLFSVIDPATVTDPLKTEVQDLASQAIENLKRYTEALSSTQCRNNAKQFGASADSSSRSILRSHPQMLAL